MEDENESLRQRILQWKRLDAQARPTLAAYQAEISKLWSQLSAAEEEAQSAQFRATTMLEGAQRSIAVVSMVAVARCCFDALRSADKSGKVPGRIPCRRLQEQAQAT